MRMSLNPDLFVLHGHESELPNVIFQRAHETFLILKLGNYTLSDESGNKSWHEKMDGVSKDRLWLSPADGPPALALVKTPPPPPSQSPPALL